MMSIKTKPGIYRVTIGDRFYIGSAANLSQRRSRHLRDLRSGKHQSPIMQNAFNKHGEDRFGFETILVCEKGDLLMYEQKLIDKHYSDELCMNACRVAGSHLGLKRSDETKRRMSISAKGRKNPIMAEMNKYPDMIEKMNVRKRGRPLSDAHKKALKEAWKRRRAEGKPNGGRPPGSHLKSSD
jgi:group I intron endonuclease